LARSSGDCNFFMENYLYQIILPEAICKRLQFQGTSWQGLFP
jgi:hypothetical protein